MTKPLMSSGFTIIELMIATGVFSIVLLICSTAIIVIGQEYYKAAISALTQDASRNIIDDVSRQIELSGAMPTPNTGLPSNYAGFQQMGEVQAVCIGSVRYTYVIGWQVENVGGPDKNKHQSPHGLWRDTLPPGGSCTTVNLGDPNLAADDPEGGTEMLPLHTRLANFMVSNNDSTNATDTLWNIDVSLIYGDDELLTPQPPTTGALDSTNFASTKCVFSNGGGTFCDISDLHTAAFRSHS